jgi:hypothetical protein
MPSDHRIGGLMKLDPRKPANPVVWSFAVGRYNRDGGILSTPALYKGVVYVTIISRGSWRGVE